MLIVGSLYWDDHATRKSLRNKFLKISDSKSVPAPIRYGRKSDLRNTVTMVFSSSCASNNTMGLAKLVPFKNAITSTKELDEIASAIIKAEHKKEPNFNRFNWEWGCLAVLVNPKVGKNIAKELKDYWSKKIGKKFDPSEYRIGKEKPIVSSIGMLQFDWQVEYGNFDFVVVTATKPNIDPIPESDDLAAYFSKDSNYFENNYKAGILTYQDTAIRAVLDHPDKDKSIPILDWVPEGWTPKRLGQLFQFKNGINAGKESYGGGIKFINVMEVIYNDCITPELIPGSVNVSREQKKLYSVQKGDVLFNRTSETADEIGLSSVYMADETVVFGGFVIRGTPLSNVLDLNFKKYCFRANYVRSQIIKGGQGAIRTNIGQNDLEKIIIALPPLPEQRRIASFIGKWDEAILATEKLIAKREQKAEWLTLQLLFGKQRLKGFNKKWNEYRLGDFFDERIETNHINLQLLSIGQSGVYPQSESDKRDISNVDKSKYRRICKGDIGYNTMRMWQGRSALSALEGIVSPAYTILKPNKKADPLFFSYLFQTPKLINAFYRNSQGLVEDTLNCKYHDFAIIKAQLPEKDEQQAISNLISISKQEIKMLKAKLDLLKKQKKGLMQILLTGKKRLNF